MCNRFVLGCLCLSAFWASCARAEDGYEMWLRYQPVANESLRQEYQMHVQHIIVEGNSPTLTAAAAELERGLSGLLATTVTQKSMLAPYENTAGNVVAGAGVAGAVVIGAVVIGVVIIGTPKNSPLIAAQHFNKRLAEVGDEGYLIETKRIGTTEQLFIAANTDVGVLYGSFHLLRLLQTEQSLQNLSITSAPKLQYRVVNHWDNVNRLVERGYAGLSLWDWGTLPEFKSTRYTDYARINASLGINGTVINNVNADPRMMSDQFLKKIAVLAEVFRPYGIKLYLSINYNAPRAYGDLDTADPLDPRVRAWWKMRTEKIYYYIPDFGGFLVKADSEGQPGPQGYGRNHADGANMLADILKPHSGVVFWRAFVYHPDIGDRFRGAYDEFAPLDGKFRENVILQIKNGPIDFQPREPVSPLFSSLKKTNMMIEVQVTQEYFGFATHLAYQGPLFEEALKTDLLVKGKGSTLANILSGQFNKATNKNARTGMAAVINPGTDRNWTGHPFVQSSWYAFGRMAWDYSLTSNVIADEWLRMTFSNQEKFIAPIKKIMLASREAGVNYRSPLGLTHLYSQGDHYGPAPWTADMTRADWNAVYYHRAAKDGVGFNRTESGSNALAQYPAELAKQYADINSVPEELMLWFHHVNWDHKMKSGRSLWEELVDKYYTGVAQVRTMQTEWNSIEGQVDAERFAQVKALLAVQERDAVRWRDSSVLYFQSISTLPIPAAYEKPEHDLEYYKMLARTTYVPDPWHPAGASRVLK